VFELEALPAMGEGGGVRGDPVVGTANRGERQFLPARFPRLAEFGQQ
jgi:hypothetical protein